MKDESQSASTMVPGSGRKLRVVALFLFMAAAGYFMFSAAGQSSSALPDSVGDGVQYLCITDQHAFTLTPRQLNEARERLGGGRPGTAPCPKCNQHTGRRAEMIGGKLVAMSGGDGGGTSIGLPPPLSR